MIRYTIDPAQFTENEWEQFTLHTRTVAPAKYRFHRDAKPFRRPKKQIVLSAMILRQRAASNETQWIALSCFNAAKKLEALLPEKKRALPADPEDQNDDRAEWARIAVQAFQDETGLGEGDGLDTAIGDLLADLAHLCDRENLRMEALLLHAKYHYDEETNPDHENDSARQGTQFDFLKEEN